MSTDANSTTMNGRVPGAAKTERVAAPSGRSRLATRLGLHEDRVGPIPGGLAAWLGAAIFWSGLAWLIFG
jgi:hypothetical protein